MFKMSVIWVYSGHASHLSPTHYAGASPEFAENTLWTPQNTAKHRKLIVN
jgi:hypothetical protein